MKQNIVTVIICASLFVSSLSDKAYAEKLEEMKEEFQNAIKIKDCSTISTLLPALVERDNSFYNVLGNFYEKGVCFSKDDAKAFEAYAKIPDDSPFKPFFRIGTMYSEGRGVAQDTNKAQAFFEAGLQEQIKYTPNFAEIRQGVSFLLLDKKFPEDLEKLVSSYEAIETDPERKFQFSLDYIKKAQSAADVEQGYIFLINLVQRHNHTEAAYRVSKWYKTAQKMDESFSYLLAAARNGKAIAQAEIGRSFFSGDNSNVSKTVAYEMLLRAQRAGLVDQTEIDLAAEQMHSSQIERATEEAAKPLPQ